MKERNKRIQIAFDGDTDLKRQIKIQAALWGISMNQWIKSALYKELKRQLLETPKE
jgi:predicted HicB family RNase H-like nuclease